MSSRELTMVEVGALIQRHGGWRAEPDHLLLDEPTIDALRRRLDGVWRGREAAFVLASGPGLTEEVAEAVRRAHETRRFVAVVVNDAWRRAPWADVLYSSDSRWMRFYSGAEGFRGLKVSGHPDSTKFPAEWGFVTVQGEAADDRGFSWQFPTVHYGHNSGYSAVNLALIMGARRIVLCGFNMGPAEDGRTHFFAEARPRELPDNSPYREFRTAFERAAQDHELVARGIEIMNATPGTHLACFPVMTVEEAIAKL